MKAVLIFVLLLNSFFLSAQKTNLKIENHWINLTEQDGKLILFYPCDADIKQIIIDAEKNELTMKYGQEDDVFKILSTNYVSNKELNFNILYSTFGKPQETTVNVKFIDVDKRIAKWSFTLIDGKTELNNEYLMISEPKSINYKIVKQPCRECWTEEDCDSIKKNNK